MAQERVERRLAAILAADVVGYSRLMGEDEAGTLAALKDHQAQFIDPTIAEHQGRIVKLMGDGVLVEFASVVAAVECAVAIQRGMADRNSDVPVGRRIDFRIGVNLGDVIIDGEDIHGDGVNIAARLEGLAEAGGICIPRKVFHEVRNKLDVGYAFIGEQTVKNIETPIPAYSVLLEPDAAGKVIGEKPTGRPRWQLGAVAAAALIAVAGTAVWWQPWVERVEAASIERMAFPLPDKPSIAVLPFDNLSGDAEQEYLADGIAENIISTLSQIPGLFVIARNSTFTYKGKPVKVQKVAEDLGVQYVLEGSVQRSGEMIRITAQLIDAIEGHHLWSERYDRKFTDLFAVQDELTLKIATELQVKLTQGEQARLRLGTKNLQAWSYVVKAGALFHRLSKEHTARARELYKKAIELDPSYAAAWTGLGQTHSHDARMGRSTSRALSIQKSKEAAREALALDPDYPSAHSLLGFLHLLHREHDKAITAGRKAIELAPSASRYYGALAISTFYAGDFSESLALTKKAMRLHPHYPSHLDYRLGAAYRMLGQYEESVAALKAFVARNPSDPIRKLALAATYGMMGRLADARALVDEFRAARPSGTLKNYARIHFFKNPKHLEPLLAALRQAGLPENPPLKLPDKPSIAVLPFTNMSGDAEQEYFADGMTEDIITDLSKISGLFVIARNSSFQYKGKSPDLRDVGRALGVKYVLEGSVRRAGDQMRINAQLVDARTGNHLWAERYDRELSDIFGVQDDVVGRIVSALAVELTDADKARRMRRRKTVNLQAYEYVLHGRQLVTRIAGQDIEKAREFFEKAISIDPGYARAYTNLGLLYWNAWRLWGRDRAGNLTRALQIGRKAVAHDPDDAGARTLLALVHQFRKEHDLAEIEANKAIALGPTHVETLGNLGGYLWFAGRPLEAIEYLERAVRLDPYHPSIYLTWLGGVYSWSGRYDLAITMLKRAIRREPDYIVNHVALAAAYAHSGKDEDARAEAADIIRLNPNFTLRAFKAFVPIRKKVDLDRYVMGLRQAGLPE